MKRLCLYFILSFLLLTMAWRGTPGAKACCLAGQQVSAGSAAPAVDSAGFCNSLLLLLKDASLNFERIKGKFIEASNDTVRWTTAGGLSGAITSALTNANRKHWEYEGIVYLGNSAGKQRDIYTQYRAAIERCLPQSQYQPATGQDEKSAKGLQDLKYTARDGRSVILRPGYEEITGTYSLSILLSNN